MSLRRLPRPRSGRKTVIRFRPECEQSPIVDGVQLTNTVRDGSQVVTRTEKARLTFKNGNSLVDDGVRVSVLDSQGKLRDQFPGTIQLSKEKVTITDSQNGRSHTWSANGKFSIVGCDRKVESAPQGLGAIVAEIADWRPKAEQLVS